MLVTHLENQGFKCFFRFRVQGIILFRHFLNRNLQQLFRRVIGKMEMIREKSLHFWISSQSFIHRLIIAFAVTDELFGIAIARRGALNPWYYYGAMAVAIPGWAFGTASGIIAGSALPERIVSALSVALFGMFLAIIIPPARASRMIFTVVLTSFIASFVAANVQPLAQLTGGTRTIILTVLIAAGAAWFSPVSDQRKEG